MPLRFKTEIYILINVIGYNVSAMLYFVAFHESGLSRGFGENYDFSEDGKASRQSALRKSVISA